MAKTTIETKNLILKSDIQLKNELIVWDREKEINLASIKPIDLKYAFACSLKSGELVCNIGFNNNSYIEITYNETTDLFNYDYLNEAFTAIVKWYFDNTTYDELYTIISGDNNFEKIIIENGFKVTKKELVSRAKSYVKIRT